MPNSFGQVVQLDHRGITVEAACHCMPFFQQPDPKADGDFLCWADGEYDIISEEEFKRLKAEHICKRDFSPEEICGNTPAVGAVIWS